MKLINLPAKISVPFASLGSKNILPQLATSSTLQGGDAAYSSGFPPITMTPREAGGVAPQGEDFNGIIYDITNKLQASDAGVVYPFDADFASSIGGYAQGARIISSDYTGFWLNTIDSNSNNPEGTATNSTGWVPVEFTGSSIVPIQDANVTMTCLAAAKKTLVLTGNLTANRYLYIPSWVNTWEIINNCTGFASVIISTINGNITASIPTQSTVSIYCDGTSVYYISGINFSNGSLKQKNGYSYLPTGVLLQWGQANISYSGKIIFPIPFPINCVNISISDRNGSSTHGYLDSSVSNSGFTAVTSFETLNLSWQAIGY